MTAPLPAYGTRLNPRYAAQPLGTIHLGDKPHLVLDIATDTDGELHARIMPKSIVSLTFPVRTITIDPATRTDPPIGPGQAAKKARYLASMIGRTKGPVTHNHIEKHELAAHLLSFSGEHITRSAPAETIAKVTDGADIVGAIDTDSVIRPGMVIWSVTEDDAAITPTGVTIPGGLVVSVSEHPAGRIYECIDDSAADYRAAATLGLRRWWLTSRDVRQVHLAEHDRARKVWRRIHRLIGRGYDPLSVEERLWFGTAVDMVRLLDVRLDVRLDTPEGTPR